jgi:hypothetical protein
LSIINLPVDLPAVEAGGQGLRAELYELQQMQRLHDALQKLK